MGAFATIVEAMAGMDVFQLFFPWLLVFSITYGILTSSEIVSDDGSVNGMVALALAFITIGGSYFFVPAGLYASFGAALSFGVMGIVGLVVMLGLAGYDVEDVENLRSSPPAIAALVIVVLSFLGVLAFNLPLGALFGPIEISGDVWEDVVLPVMVLGFLLAVVYVSSSDD